jgi:hypothetical protein
MPAHQVPESSVPEGAAPVAPQPKTAEEAIAAADKEYGAWVATQQIYVGTALAYNEGDPVPASNVARHGYDKAGLAARRSTNEGKAALQRVRESVLTEDELAAAKKAGN